MKAELGAAGVPPADNRPTGGTPVAPARARARRGFTLIEVLVVISIILFLIAFVIVAAVRYTGKAREEATRALLQKVQMSLDRYYGREGTELPDGESGRLYPRTDPNRTGTIGATNPAKGTVNLYPCVKPYFKAEAGETRDISGQTMIVDPWGTEIVYWASTPEVAIRGSYQLYSYGPNKEWMGGGADGKTAPDDDIRLTRSNY